MSGPSSLCAFCRSIPFDGDDLELRPEQLRLEQLRLEGMTESVDGWLRSSHSTYRDSETRAGSQRIRQDGAVFDLGTTDRVLGSSCPFCRVVATAVRDIKRNIGWKDLKADTSLRLRWSKVGPGNKGVFTLNDKDDVYICFVGDRAMGPLTAKLVRSRASIIYPAALHVVPSEVARWIADCEQKHGAECNAEASVTGLIKDSYRGLPLMRFVDVHQKCIVERTEVVRYVALSYVWGAAVNFRLTKTNQPQMRKPGVLSESWFELPATIRDAIDLTRACGEKYLWVDSLCIMQNDVEDLDVGTRAMDLICKSAASPMQAPQNWSKPFPLRLLSEIFLSTLFLYLF